MTHPDVATVDRYLDTDPSDRLLSVAEIQNAFRSLRQPRSRPGLTPTLRETGTRTRQVSQWDEDAPDTASDPRECWPDTPRPTAETRRIELFGSSWIAVIAAHAGAGASTVALAITDALSDAGRTARLVDTAQPSRSGLVAAATSELGTDPTGSWRRGSRNTATLYRRTGNADLGCWPTPSPDSASDSVEVTTVVDLGLPSPDTTAQLTAIRPCIVVVCHASVPGIRSAEHALDQLVTQSVVMAVVGPNRWPGVLTAGLGPRLRTHRDAGQVVIVPTERHLHLSGVTAGPLPRPVAAAGRALLAVLDDAHTHLAHTDIHTTIHTRSDPTSTSSSTDERTDR
jgi:hypothetical protein